MVIRKARAAVGTIPPQRYHSSSILVSEMVLAPIVQLRLQDTLNENRYEGAQFEAIRLNVDVLSVSKTQR
jgi:hypothetical protein